MDQRQIAGVATVTTNIDSVSSSFKVHHECQDTLYTNYKDLIEFSEVTVQTSERLTGCYGGKLDSNSFPSCPDC